MSGHVNVRIRCVKKAFINNMKKELIFLTSRTLAVINILQLEGHCGIKVSRSQANIYENFANYFLKTKGNNKCFIVSNVHACKGLQKSICELER